MKIARQPLDIEPPYDKMWLSIRKVIDTLHVRNHVGPNCKTDLHPDKIGECHPDLKHSKNTQAGEQTFVWLGRYKKIMGSMPKNHFMFYLHRLVVRRNQYIEKCYRLGRKPLYPNSKPK